MAIAGRPLELLPLTLNVKMKAWRDVKDPNFADVASEFDQMRRRALERDNYSCRFCSFRALKYQEVHHFNDDHEDNRLENLVTACQYCHMCQHIGLWGSRQEAALIWCPEYTQVELNHLVRTLQVAKYWAGQRAGEAAAAATNKAILADARSAQEVADAAAAIFAALKARRSKAEDYFKTSDPMDLANVLLLTPDEALHLKDSWNKGMRLLPLGVRKQGNDDVAQKWLEVWLGPGGPYCNIKPNTWVSLLKTALRN